MSPLLLSLVDAAVRGLVVAILIGTVLALVPRSHATLRLRAWTVVLYALLALPIIGMLAPAWFWPMTPVPVFEAPAVLAAANAVSAAAVAPAAPVHASTDAVAGVQWPLVLTTIYFAGLAWFLFQAVLAWHFVRRLQQQARVIDDASLLQRVTGLSMSVPGHRVPVLAESQALFAPVTMFVRHPTIVLPDDWRTWPAEQLNAVLAHEMAHVARRDALTQRLALAYRAIFWFSPLSWWLNRHVSRLAELASDEAALKTGIEPVAYADALLACFVRAHAHPRRTAWHLAMARRDDVEAARRIERILSWKGGPNMARMKWVLVGVGALSISLTLLAASVQFPSATLPAISTVNANVDSTVAPAQMPVRIGGDIKAPRQIVRVDPVYPAMARAAKVEAQVQLEATIDQTGSVKDVRVSRGVALFNAAAVDAVRQWKYEPTLLNGVPTPVLLPIAVNFFWQDPAPTVVNAVPAPESVQTPAQKPTPMPEPQTTDDAFLKGSYDDNTPDLVKPESVKIVKPRYTPDAMRQKLQGMVSVEIIIGTDGKVTNARIKESLDKRYGLDDAALQAARESTFTAGKLNGTPVPVHTILQLEFRLH